MRVLIYDTGQDASDLSGVAEAAGAEIILSQDASEVMENGLADLSLVSMEMDMWKEVVKSLSERGSLVYVVADNPDLDAWEAATSSGARAVWKREKMTAELTGALKKLGTNSSDSQPPPVPARNHKRAVRPMRKPGRASEQRRDTKGQAVNNGQNKVKEPVEHSPEAGIAGPKWQPDAAPRQRQQRELVVVYSSDGGVGKTTLSINLAVAIAASKVASNTVCLVELDPYHCHICSRLATVPTTTVLDWVVGRQDDLENYLVDYKIRVGKEERYLKILPAPHNPADEVVVTPEVVEKLLNILYRRFDTVIVDTCPTLVRDSTLMAMDMASKIIMVTTPDKSQIANIYSDYEMLKNTDTGVISKTGLVVNRIDKRSPIRLADIRNTILLPLAAVIPEDSGVRTEFNRERVPVLGRRAKHFNQQLFKLANTIADVVNPEEKRGIKLPRIFRRTSEVFAK